MKKITLFLFSLIVSLVIFCGLYVKADAPTVTMVNGAQVRTADPAGLRFQATASTLEGVDEHGFYVALGNHSLSDMRTAIEAGETTVGGNKLVKKAASGEDLTFAVTVYDIPESGYEQEVTAIAYLKSGDTYTFNIAVTKNIAVTAMAALNAGYTGTILTNVATYLSSHYMVKSGTFNQFYEYTITPLVTVKYGFSDLADLYDEFLADYNAATGASLTNSTTAAEFYNSLKTGISSGDYKIDETDNMAKMFDGANLVKWGWLLEYFKDNYADHIKNQAQALLAANRTASSYQLYTFDHLAYSIWNFFHTTSEHGYYIAAYFPDEASYDAVTWPSVTDMTGENVVAIGDTVALPAAPSKLGYDFSEYFDGSDSYNPGDTYTVTSSANVFKSEFFTVSYDINYHLNGGTNSVNNPDTYDIETATIVLEEATKAEYVFAGWFEEDDFSGEIVTQIAKGSTGNIDLYAKFVQEKSYVNAAWSTYENGDTVTYLAHNYTYGVDAFSSLASAVAAASDYEQIYVLAGTYSEAFTITKNGVRLIGPNNEISAVDGVRNTEAIITNKITLAPGLINTSILGFKFTGAGQVYATSEDAGSTTYNIRGFNYKYNYVDKGSNTTEAIAFIEGDYTYSTDVVIDSCYFTAPNLAAFDAKKSGLVLFINNENITVKNSKFYNIPQNAVAVYDSTNGKGAAGDIIFDDNTFLDITKGAIWMNWYSPLSGTSHIIRVKGNYLENVNGAAGVDFEGSNTGATYASLRVEENVFKNVFKVLWTAKSAGFVFTNNVVYKHSSPTTAYVVMGTSGYNIDCTRNLYLSTDGSTAYETVYSTDGSTGFRFNARAVNANTNNYASKAAYNAAGLTYTID